MHDNGYIQKFGRNIDVDVAEDIIEQGGDYPWPATAFIPTISSTSALDKPGSTGANTVRVDGLDTDYNNQNETITLNGTDSVTLTNTYIRIHRAYVALTGNAGNNVGVIDILNGVAVVARIAATFGQTLQATYTIPAINTRAKLVKWWVQPFLTASESVELALLTRDFDTNSWRTRAWSQIRTTGASRWDHRYDPMGILITARADVRLRVLAVSAANTIVSGGFDIALDREP